jgi:hypothetical protein
MKFRVFLFSTVLIAASCKKNNPIDQPPIANNQAVTWIKTFGGSNFDFYNAAIETAPGEYVIAGTTRSIDGDLSGARVSYDPWLTKIDNNGNKVWSVAFGDNSDEYVTDMAKTTDGGYIMIYYSGFPLLPTGGTPNYAWAVKTDGSGAKQWEKKLTNSNDAQPFAITTTSDGNYLVAGYAVGGNGTRQGWITKFDNSGNPAWEKFYGGGNEDFFTGIAKSSDGGFVLSGYTKSNNGDIESNKGDFDGWLMKVDGSGNKVWSKTYGGTGEDNLNSIVATTDGGFAALGSSKSNNGDVGANKGGWDSWIIKIDGSGSKQWVKTYGGTNDEFMTSLVSAPGGGFVTGGYSNSFNGDVSRTSGDFGGWLLKLDNNGNKTGASTYGGPGDEVLYSLSTTQDGGYLIAGTTATTNNGYDGWLVKVGPF